MMCRILSALLFTFISQKSAAANYVINMGNDLHDISMNEEIKIQIGEKYLPVKWVQKEVLTLRFTSEAKT